jgi:hypothetical protein
MKFHRSSHRVRLSAFTLAETLITVAVFALVGGMVFLILNAGMILYAKNTAVNSAHQQARTGIDEMLANIHASVSIPQLVNIQTSLLPNGSRMVALASPGLGPAAGLIFQKFDGGPFTIAQDANASDDSVDVNVQNYIPKPIMRFNIPTHDIEANIGSAATPKWKSPTLWTVDLVDDAGNSQPLGRDINVDATHPVIGFTTYRVGYLVVGQNLPNGTFLGELRYFPILDLLNTDINDVKNYKVIARNITSGTPFHVLLNATGGVDNRSIAAIQLCTAEPQYSSRGFAAVNMFINSFIPFRTKLTNRQ